MRPVVLSIGICACALGIAWAQNDGGATQQVPVGQTFKNFEFPLYQGGEKKATLTASQATGITQNRAETMDLKIQIYDNGEVTTTITSPQADLYVAEQKMRTSHTVQIERADMEATAQNCDFDLQTKKYLLRNNVKVTLRNFDPGTSLTPSTGAPTAPAPIQAKTTDMSPRSLLNSDSLPESSAASTNSAPIPPTSSDSK